MLGFSDALASLVGSRFGKHHFLIINNKKTFEGSTAFFFTTILILFFLGIFGTLGVILSLLLTLFEAVLVFGLDNLVVPVIAALLFKLFFL